MLEYTPLEVAIALSLYRYNFSPGMAAHALHEHFKGRCAEMPELITWCQRGYITDMPIETAHVYVIHALERYGLEAKERAKYL